MKIFLDQNIHEPILEWLQARVGSGVLVASTRTLKMEREDDDVLFAFCQRESYVMVTNDEGFQNPLVVPNVPGLRRCALERLSDKPQEYTGSVAQITSRISC